MGWKRWGGVEKGDRGRGGRQGGAVPQGPASARSQGQGSDGRLGRNPARVHARSGGHGLPRLPNRDRSQGSARVERCGVQIKEVREA